MSGKIENHMHRHPQNNKETVKFDERFNSYYIPTGGDPEVEVIQEINFCPWCGDKLPESLRDKWFADLKALGINPWNDEIPERYKSSAWFRE